MSAVNACPQCGAATRPDAAWCSLCFAQLAGGFDPLTAPIEEVLGQSEGTTKTVTPPVVHEDIHEDIETYDVAAPRHVADPITTAQVAVGPAVEPLVDVNGSTAGAELSEVDVMLALLAAEHRQGDPTGAWADRFGDKGVRMMIIMGGTAAMAAICFVVLTVFGALT